MSIQEQIAANAARANEMIKQLSGEPADAPVDGDPAADNDVDQPAPAGEAAAPAPAPSDPAPAPAAGDTQTDDENSETFAQRWRSLQGVHNSLQAKLRDADAARRNLEQLVAQMQAAPAQPAKPRASHITDKDSSEYGGEMVDFVRRAARDEMAPLAQAVQAMAAQVQALRRLGPVVESVAHTQVANTRDQFYDSLTKAVPDWQSVNANEGFLGWLVEEDEFTGLQRDTLLKDAHDNLDLGRVVSIFNAYKRLNGTPPTAAAPAAVAQTPAVPSARERLERQVAPGRASTGTAPPQSAQKKQWTREDIAAFYRDKMSGKYKGKEQQMQALERDIFDAQHEGRVDLRAA